MPDTQPNTRAKRTVSDVSIRPTENGGFVVNCSYDNRQTGPSYESPKTYAFSNAADMIDHVEALFGVTD